MRLLMIATNNEKYHSIDVEVDDFHLLDAIHARLSSLLTEYVFITFFIPLPVVSSDLSLFDDIISYLVARIRIMTRRHSVGVQHLSTFNMNIVLSVVKITI
ncbi:unnamed protein product [Amoebophrya sp. A25]|nr:unnamed protein product [Amoebophrya sp. A25]|eukprot:GSA25T00006043001.1